MDLVLHAVEAGHHHRREREVRIRASDPGSALRCGAPSGCDTHGMRIDAERLRAEYASLIGASKPGTRRLYELVPGLVIAFSAFACLMMPPM